MDYDKLAEASEKHVEELGRKNEILFYVKAMSKAVRYQADPEVQAKIRRQSTIPWRELYEQFTI